MKKLLAIAALFAAMIFTGCSKDDDVESDDATVYSGELLGSWEWDDEPNLIFTFYNNGAFEGKYQEGSEWESMSGIFTVTEDVLYIEYRAKSWNYDGESGSEVYDQEQDGIDGEFYKYKVSGSQLLLDYLGAAEYYTLDEALDATMNESNADTLTKK